MLQKPRPSPGRTTKDTDMKTVALLVGAFVLLATTTPAFAYGHYGNAIQSNIHAVVGKLEKGLNFNI